MKNIHMLLLETAQFSPAPYSHPEVRPKEGHCAEDGELRTGEGEEE